MFVIILMFVLETTTDVNNLMFEKMYRSKTMFDSS